MPQAATREVRADDGRGESAARTHGGGLCVPARAGRPGDRCRLLASARTLRRRTLRLARRPPAADRGVAPPMNGSRWGHCMGPALLGLTACLAPATGGDVDLAPTERKIAKEPRYVAAPRYALFVLDEAADFRPGAVFDKSTPDAPFYDVLYFDRNGNGDLIEPAERFLGKRD